MQQLVVEILRLCSPVKPGVQVLLLYSVVQSPMLEELKPTNSYNSQSTSGQNAM